MTNFTGSINEQQKSEYNTLLFRLPVTEYIFSEEKSEKKAVRSPSDVKIENLEKLMRLLMGEMHEIKAFFATISKKETVSSTPPAEKTLRDEIAIEAMHAFIAGEGSYTHADTYLRRIASAAYYMADIMLAERNKPVKTGEV